MVRHRLADRIENNLAAMLERTAALLREHRRDVLVLAHALETHKTLTGEDVGAVLDGYSGPTVDGRPYADPAFLRQIEAHHRAAVIAHQNHTGIMLSLPIPPDPVPSSQWAPPPGVAQPAERGPARPGPSASDLAQSDLAQSDLAQSDLVQPDLSQPGSRHDAGAGGHVTNPDEPAPLS
jgi:hypothetical protein